jgi:hypothetical protein
MLKEVERVIFWKVNKSGSNQTGDRNAPRPLAQLAHVLVQKHPAFDVLEADPRRRYCRNGVPAMDEPMRAANKILARV